MAKTENEEAPNTETTPEEEALFLKNLAEKKYTSRNLKSAIRFAERAHKLYPTLDGLSEMLTAFEILQTATKPVFETAAESNSSANLDYYKILQVERFAQINSIKKQYKKLALTLHPDKNPFMASEEAFKLVAEAFRVLSDKIRRKEFDMRLRIAMQSEAGGGDDDDEGIESSQSTFWTACSTCRLLHQFEKKYMGHNLMCPRCKKSFKAVEVEDKIEDDGENDENVSVEKNVDTNGFAPTRISARIRERVKKVGKLGDVEKKVKKTSSLEEVLERTRKKVKRNVCGDGEGVALKRVEKMGNFKISDLVKELRSTKVGGKVRDRGEELESIEVEVEESERAKRAKIREEETMTLAQMKTLVRKKGDKETMKVDDDKAITHEDNEKSNLTDKDEERGKEKENEMLNVSEKRVSRRISKDKFLDVMKRRVLDDTLDTEIDGLRDLNNDDLEIMPVEDSDFYDFDKDRRGRNIKQAQVWAIYDDNDGMPRQYALIDEVVSLNPFEVTISWLDFRTDGNELWTGSLENMSPSDVSCGTFKVSRKTSVKYVNMFSHVVHCERAARELYRIYPKKGSIWALYNENTLNTEGTIVVCLTSFDHVYGLSMAYLEKVHGFRTIFKRREIGANAIRLIEKDDIKLFSHQIPARKLSGDEAPGLPKDCWELDPASLSPQFAEAVVREIEC